MGLFNRKPKKRVYPKTTYFDTWSKKKQRAYYEAIIAEERNLARRATDRWLGEAAKNKALEKELERLNGKSAPAAR